MKRIVMLLTVALVMAVMMVASAGNAFASANPDNNGKTENAPGQQTAKENCTDAVIKQSNKGVRAGGGPKDETNAPINCDHFWQNTGSIGNS